MLFTIARSASPIVEGPGGHGKTFALSPSVFTFSEDNLTWREKAYNGQKILMHVYTVEIIVKMCFFCVYYAAFYMLVD